MVDKVTNSGQGREPAQAAPDEQLAAEILAGLPGPHEDADVTTARWLATPAARGAGWVIIGWLRRARQARRTRPGALLDAGQREVLAEVLQADGPWKSSA
jgi:hypothetical protein